MYELLKELSELRGISGFEYRIADKIEEMFAPYADEVKRDALGNVIAVKRSALRDAPRIMLEAHMDEIGMMVSGIDDNGYLSFVCVGGIDARVLPAAEVTVHGMRDIPGVIGAKPPHLQTAGENKKSMKTEDMAIDTGLSHDEVKSIVSVGDAVTFSGNAGRLCGGMVSLKTMDDRAGIAALLGVLKKLLGTELGVDVYAVAAVCEEVGCRGARTAAFGTEPDAAIVVDVTHGVTPDNQEDAFDTGSGAVVAVGPNIHPAVSKKLFALAEKYGIKTETEVEGGDTGTDAWVVQVSRNGVPTGLLSIPLKYMHTPVETLDMADVEAVSELMYRFVCNFSGEDMSSF